MSTELESIHILGTFVSHRRGQRRLHPKQAILTIDSVYDRETAQKYVRNGVLFTYTRPEGDVVNIHGFIKAVHGNKGAVRATFERNLNPKAQGQRILVKLYKIE
ncbi:ribosomal prt L35A [Enterospora canceri]|uniref:Ribosomal prt L35A n=1 Tax=Enterospora canceri TaxID=1081671 RepID=A0A1Y1S826_9MICR|nr:ribosomal prt L35A [Enterospora canceri]